MPVERSRSLLLHRKISVLDNTHEYAQPCLCNLSPRRDSLGSSLFLSSIKLTHGVTNGHNYVPCAAGGFPSSCSCSSSAAIPPPCPTTQAILTDSSRIMHTRGLARALLLRQLDDADHQHRVVAHVGMVQFHAAVPYAFHRSALIRNFHQLVQVGAV